MKARIFSRIGLFVNIRMEADIGSPIVARLTNNTIVDVVSRGKEWSAIVFDTKNGYVMNQFLVFGEEQ